MTSEEKRITRNSELMYDNGGWKVIKMHTYEAFRARAGEIADYLGLSSSDFHQARKEKEYVNDYFVVEGGEKVYGIKDSNWRCATETPIVDSNGNLYSLRDISDIIKIIPMNVLKVMPTFNTIEEDYKEAQKYVDENGTFILTEELSHKANAKYIFLIKPLIRRVIIKKEVNLFYSYMFDGCANLKEVEFESGFKGDTLYCNMFSNCKCLKSIKLPSSIWSLGGGSAFENCTSLENVEWEGATKRYCTPEIEYATFRNCTSLKNFNLPDTIERIDVDAFAGCSSLESVNITKNTSLRSLNMEAFKGCPRLTSINLPSDLDVASSAGSKLPFEYTSINHLNIYGKYKPCCFRNKGLKNGTTISWIDRNKEDVVSDCWSDEK